MRRWREGLFIAGGDINQSATNGRTRTPTSTTSRQLIWKLSPAWLLRLVYWRNLILSVFTALSHAHARPPYWIIVIAALLLLQFIIAIFIIVKRIDCYVDLLLLILTVTWALVLNQLDTVLEFHVYWVGFFGAVFQLLREQLQMYDLLTMNISCNNIHT